MAADLSILSTLPDRHFLLIQDTFCHGIVPVERDVNNDIVLYSTREEAEAERTDADELRCEAEREAGMEAESVDTSLWVEAVVRLPDGSLYLPESRMYYTANKLRKLVE